MLRFILALVLLAAAALYAFRRGGTPEKQVATILVGIQLTDMAYHWLGGESIYDNVDTFHAFNDGWALLALVAVALTANRFWPLWVAALQVIASFSHYARMVDLSVPPMAYAVMIRVPLWGQIFVLLLGTWNYARQRKAALATSLQSSHVSAPLIPPTPHRG
jgi:hypothetical protein